MEAPTVHTERWDLDKAAAMANLLITRTEFPELLDTHEVELAKLHQKQLGIVEKSTQRSFDLSVAEPSPEITLPLRLRAVAVRAILEETEVKIELIELRNKQINDATLVSDTLLDEYSRFYDTDPERFAGMTGEEFGEHVQAVDDLRGFVRSADAALSNTRQTMDRSDYYGECIEKGDKPQIDWAVVDVACDSFRYPLERMFGPDSDEVRQLKEEYTALNEASYDTYTPQSMVLAFCELNRKWHQFISDSKLDKELELQSLLAAQDSADADE